MKDGHGNMGSESTGELAARTTLLPCRRCRVMLQLSRGASNQPMPTLPGRAGACVFACMLLLRKRKNTAASS